MRTLIAVTIACIFLTVVFGITSVVTGLQAKAFTSELQLAYDSSAPATKAAYIREFIAKSEEKNLPEYGSWIIQRADLKTERQVGILEDLAFRCEQIAPLDPESYGYAQGMTQITNDEFEYTISSTRSFFNKAYRINSGWFIVNGWTIFLSLSVIFGFCLAAKSDSW